MISVTDNQSYYNLMSALKIKEVANRFIYLVIFLIHIKNGVL